MSTEGNNKEKEVIETKESPISKEQLNQEKISEIREQINKVTNSDLLEKIIQDNQFEFKHEDILYRVVAPTFEQKQNANQKRLAKYMELLRNPDLVMEAELRQLYKKKGIYIDEMDKQFNALVNKKESYMFKIGKALKEKKSEQELQVYKSEIEKIIAEQQEISIKKTTLLEYSIEHQIMIYVYSYLTYLIAEKKIEDKWIPVWATYEQFMQDKTSIINTVTFYASLIISNELK